MQSTQFSSHFHQTNLTVLLAHRNNVDTQIFSTTLLVVFISVQLFLFLNNNICSTVTAAHHKTQLKPLNFYQNLVKLT